MADPNKPTSKPKTAKPKKPAKPKLNTSRKHADEVTMKIVACNICNTKEATVSDADASKLAEEHAANAHVGTNLKHLLERHITISIQE